MKSVRLPYLRQISRCGQGLLKDGQFIGYTWLRWTYNLYLKQRCYQSWIRFEVEQGKRHD